MKKKILFIIILLSIFILPVFAEELPFEFTNEFGLNYDYWEEINFTRTLKTEDGNYVVSQGNIIKLVKPSGRVIWSQNLGPMTGDDKADFYIEGDYLIVTSTQMGDDHVVIFKLSNGEYVDDFNDKGGFFIDKLGDNYVVANHYGISLYNEQGDNIANANAYLISNKAIFVEDDKVYVLTCGEVLGASQYIAPIPAKKETTKYGGMCTPSLYILDSDLEVVSGTTITGDMFDNVGSFFKVGNDYYVTHFDVFKINSNGVSTMIIDSEEDGKNYLSGNKVGDYIVLGGERANNNCTKSEIPNFIEGYGKLGVETVDYYCMNYTLLSVYDKNFNHLEDLPLVEDEDNTYGVIKNITSTKKGFLAKWLDGDNETINITEYSIKFNITTKTDGNGDVIVNKYKANDGEKIEITVTPKPGYVLDAMTIIDANGNKITTTNNTFVMPASDVIVEATFSAKNPNTGDIAIISITLFALLSAFVLIKQKKKLNFLK